MKKRQKILWAGAGSVVCLAMAIALWLTTRPSWFEKCVPYLQGMPYAILYNDPSPGEATRQHIANQRRARPIHPQHDIGFGRTDMRYAKLSLSQQDALALQEALVSDAMWVVRSPEHTQDIMRVGGWAPGWFNEASLSTSMDYLASNRDRGITIWLSESSGEIVIRQVGP